MAVTIPEARLKREAQYFKVWFASLPKGESPSKEDMLPPPTHRGFKLTEGSVILRKGTLL